MYFVAKVIVVLKNVNMITRFFALLRMTGCYKAMVGGWWRLRSHHTKNIKCLVILSEAKNLVIFLEN